MKLRFHVILLVSTVVAVVTSREASATSTPTTIGTRTVVPTPTPYVPVLRTTPVVETGSNGRPLLYYGRIRVTTRSQRRLLDAFGVTATPTPMFDDYGLVQVGTTIPGITDSRDVWVYTIAPARVFNVLVAHGTLSGGVEVNPRLAASPQLQGYLLPGSDALDVDKLHAAHFQLTWPTHPRATCGGTSTGLVAESWYDPFSWIADEFADLLDEFGGDVGTLVRDAYSGAKAAIDALGQLINDGWCLVHSKHHSAGRIYVKDPMTGGVLNQPSGPAMGQAESLRNVKVTAAGGPLGILFTKTDADDEGNYYFGDLCSDIPYHLAVFTENDAAYVTTSGVQPTSYDDPNPTQATDDDHHDIVVDDPSAVALAAAQMGRRQAQTMFGIVPDKVMIARGSLVNDAFGSKPSVTTCGQGALLTDALLLVAGPAAVAVAPLANSDIFLAGNWSAVGGENARTASFHNPLGIATHEYGHYVMCSLIDQLGGSKHDFMNAMTAEIVHGNDDDAKSRPLRATAESFADYFVYASMGYTNYFTNYFQSAVSSPDDALHLCPLNTSCLKLNANFLKINGRQAANASNQIASRASILFDWTPMFSGALIGTAMAQMSNEPTLESIANYFGSTDAEGTKTTSEDLCAVFQSHQWDCAAIRSVPYLYAPTEFDGAAVSQNQIRWWWGPTSHFATSYGVEQVNPDDSVTELTVEDATGFAYTQMVSTGPNSRVLAFAEAQRDGAQHADSARVARCTMAAPVTSVSAIATGSTVSLTWADGNHGSGFRVLRSEDSGAFASVASTTGMSFVDHEVAPGVAYQYRVDSLNCDGVVTKGPVTTATINIADNGFLHVKAGAVGGDGSLAHPFGTLNQAMAHQAAGRVRVLVAGGTYHERVLATGVQLEIHGAYAGDFSKPDPIAHPTVIAGDASTTTFTPPELSGHEFVTTGHAVFQLTGKLDLERVTVDVAQACPSATCGRLGLAVVDGDVNLDRVTYRGTTGTFDAGPASPLTNELYITQAHQLSIQDSTLTAGAGWSMIHADGLQLAGSRIVGGASGGDVTVDRSIVFADATNPTVSGTALSVGGRASITGSVLAGSQALFLFGRGDGNEVANTTLYGNTQALGVHFINDVFVRNGSRPALSMESLLSTCLTPPCANPPRIFGVNIEKSIFVVDDNAASGFAETSYSHANGVTLTDLTKQSWFGTDADVLDAQIVTGVRAFFVSGSTDANSSTPFRTACSAAAYRTGSLDGIPPATLSTDLAGQAWSSPLDIGAYTVTCP